MTKQELKKARDAGKSVAFVYRPTRDYPTSADECVVVGLDVKRAESQSYGFRWKTLNDGVRLRFTDPAAAMGFSYLRPMVRIEGREIIREKNTTDIVVTSRQIIDTWEEYERKRDLILARKRAEQEARENAIQRRIRAARRLTRSGFVATEGRDGIVLSVEVAERLAVLVEERS